MQISEIIFPISCPKLSETDENLHVELLSFLKKIIIIEVLQYGQLGRDFN